MGNMSRYNRLKFIRERVPQTTSFKFNRSLSQRTMFMFQMKILSGVGVMYV